MDSGYALAGDASGERLVNLEVLARYVGGDLSLQRKISQRFLETARQTILEMQKAEWRGDYEQIGNLAHRIKPSAIAMGAARIAEHASRLEQAAKKKCLNSIHEQLKDLIPMMERLEWEITALA